MRSSASYLWLRLSVVVAAIIQVLAISLFFFTMWTRIRAVGSQGREAKGERF